MRRMEPAEGAAIRVGEEFHDQRIGARIESRRERFGFGHDDISDLPGNFPF